MVISQTPERPSWAHYEAQMKGQIKSEEALLRVMIRETLGTVIRGSRMNDIPSPVRNGDHILPSAGSSINDIVEIEHNVLPRAACILIVSEDGMILAVSRKNNPNDFGLPGGKVDPGESDEEAALRELEEETGLKAIDLNPVFTSDDADGYTVTTFVAKVVGNIDTDENGVIRWVKPSVLLNGSFGDYNRKLFKSVGAFKS